MGLLNRKDALNMRGYFNEMVKFIGQSVGYQYIVKQDWTIHSESNAEYSAPIRIDIIFDENPSIDTLNRLGWVSELNDEKPVIANLPYNTPNLQVNCRIIIQSVSGTPRPRVFRISKIAEDLEYPDSVVCALVPVFDQFPQKNQYTLVNNEKINQLESDRTSKDQSSKYITDDHNIDTTPQTNIDYENKYQFIDDSDSPYTG